MSKTNSSTTSTGVQNTAVGSGSGCSAAGDLDQLECEYERFDDIIKDRVNALFSSASSFIQANRGGLASSLLDSYINNAYTASVRIVRGPIWSENHYLNPDSSLKKPICLADVQRSWHSGKGRDNIRRLLMRRSLTLVDLGQRHEELPKFLTLTFRDALASYIQRGCLRRFLTTVRNYARRRGATISYFWVQEPQKRGAAHYHVILLGLPFVKASKLLEWWGQGFIRVNACNDLKHAIRYTLKYVRKMTTDDGIPDVWDVMNSAMGCRRYGMSRDVSAESRNLPAWVEEVCESFGFDRSSVKWEKVGIQGTVTSDGETVLVSLIGRSWEMVGGWCLPDDGDGGKERVPWMGERI